MRRLAVAVVMGAILLALGPAKGQSITNGSFEVGGSIDPTAGNVPTLTNLLPGWDVTIAPWASGSVGCTTPDCAQVGVNPARTWAPQTGDWSIDLAAVIPTRLSQVINNLKPETNYIVSFALAGNPFGKTNTPSGGVIKNLDVSFTPDGGIEQVAGFRFDTATTSPDNMGWVRRLFAFYSGPSTSGTLAFTNEAAQDSNGNKVSATAKGIGVALDSVSLTEALPTTVPGPIAGAGLPMLLCALGGAYWFRTRGKGVTRAA